MHTKVFVTVSKDRYAPSSERIRRAVLNYLAEQGFAGQEGRFRNSGYGDYCSIGGRWSGVLVDKQHDLWKLYGDDRVAVAFGHEDDAQIVTKELYERFLKRFEEGNDNVEPGHQSIDDGVYFLATEDDEQGWLDIDMEYEHELPTPAFIGEKWLVIVDLHE